MAVGIVMSYHKLTEEQAFTMLSLASQRSHRKVRELALSVVETGWLDPALLTESTQGDRSQGDDGADPNA